MSRPANNPVYGNSVFPLAVDDLSGEKELTDAVMAVQQSLLGGGPAGTSLSTLSVDTLTVGAGGVTSQGVVNSGSNVVGNQGVFKSGLKPGDGSVASPNRIWGGTAAPTAGLGADGDFYFRSGTPGTANQRLYVKSAGAWVGIV